MSMARVRRRLSAGLAATIAATGLVLAGQATPAGAAVGYAEFVKQAYDIYNKYLSGTPGTVEQIQAAINAAQENIITQINAVTVVQVKACAGDTLNTMKNLQQYSPDALQIQAGKAVSCLNLAAGAITDTPAPTPPDLAAVDTVGFAISAIGPMAVMINGFAGLSTSDLQQTVINSNMALFHRLTPTCFVTFTGSALPSEGPVPGHGQCYRYDAVRGYHEPDSTNIYWANSGPGIGALPSTVIGQKVQPVLWIGENKINWPAIADYTIAIDQAMAGTSYPVAVSAVKAIAPHIITVPNLLGGVDADGAADGIRAADLEPGSVTTKFVENVKAGRVGAQSPAPGTMVAPWSTVQITVSNGVVVPNVVGGFSQSNASSTIRAAGLTVGSVSTNNYDNVSADLVAAQNPPPGTIVAPGSAVAISVSLGPEPGGGGQGGCWVTCP